MMPNDPVERIRILRVLREAYRRGVKPELKATYRKRGGKTYGPYYVAYFKRVRSKGFDTPRLIYLGKENESVNFVRWLEEQSKEKVLELARLAMRHLRAALEKMVKEAAQGEVGRKRVARMLALAFDLKPSTSPRIRELLERSPSFVRVVLGPWEAWFSENVLRKLLPKKLHPAPHRRGRPLSSMGSDGSWQPFASSPPPG